MVTRGETVGVEGRLGREEITYTHYCIKQMINENLLDRPGESTQWFVERMDIFICMWEKRMDIFICMTDSHGHALETNTTL